MKTMKFFLLFNLVFLQTNCTVQSDTVCRSLPLILNNVEISDVPRRFTDSTFLSIEVSPSEKLVFSHTKKGNFAQLISEQAGKQYRHKSLGNVSGPIKGMTIIKKKDQNANLLCVDYTKDKRRYVALGLLEQGKWRPLKLKRIKENEQVYFLGGVFTIHRNNTHIDYGLEKKGREFQLKKEVCNDRLTPEKRTLSRRFSSTLISSLRRMSTKEDNR